jgi:K+-transporting ATPase KdpF subunit
VRSIRALGRPQGEKVMSLESAIVLLIAVLLMIYLGIALLKPEKF